ncbi:MAG: O-antigen ligase [Ahrensia sp.]|nr:O-antigen ligase [Ahrensia sp.]
MSNIEIPRKTDYYRLDDALDALRAALPIVVLCLLWITFQPFLGTQTAVPKSSLVNQIGYTSVTALSLTLLFTSIDRRVTYALVNLPWLLLFSGLLASGYFAPAPTDAMRAIAFSIIVVVLAASFCALPKNADAFSKALQIGCLAVLGMSYFGVIFLPTKAMHLASDLEAQHAGFWRGIYTHKNIAGPIMATLTFAGIYLFRRGMRYSGAFIILGALLFIANAGSKTSLAVTPIVAFMVLFPALMGLRGLAALAVLLTALATHALTIGTVYSSFLNDVLRVFDPTTSFTGRLEIWEFSKPFVLERPFAGYGFGGFWENGIKLRGETAFDQTWDPRGIVHGHNGFLDIALVMGLPMMLIMVWATLISPMMNYVRVPNKQENVLLADFFLMIIAFTVMNAALESFFFRRADPVWLTLVFAIFGMRLAARFPITKA